MSLTCVSAVSGAAFAWGAFLHGCKFLLPFVLVSPRTSAHTHVNNGDSHTTVHDTIAIKLKLILITRPCCIHSSISHKVMCNLSLPGPCPDLFWITITMTPMQNQCHPHSHPHTLTLTLSLILTLPSFSHSHGPLTLTLTLIHTLTHSDTHPYTLTLTLTLTCVREPQVLPPRWYCPVWGQMHYKGSKIPQGSYNHHLQSSHVCLYVGIWLSK